MVGTWEFFKSFSTPLKIIFHVNGVSLRKQMDNPMLYMCIS